MCTVPKINELMWPTLKAIKILGGSASNKEIVQTVIAQEGYSEEIQNKMHNTRSMTKLEYRMAWAKTYLKKSGALENSKRGVWSLTHLGENLNKDDIEDVVTKVKTISKEDKKQRQSTPEGSLDEDYSPDNLDWKTNLLNSLQTICPARFERLVQRILRESGFIEVEVTGKSGDGGIDGYGTLKIGLLSFRVIFQCKRFKGTVGPNYIRDFRGAMQGRVERGLFMTTGSFTSVAKKEAFRDGAPPVELFDGNDICELLKELRLGVEVRTQEVIQPNLQWFEKI